VELILVSISKLFECISIGCIFSASDLNAASKALCLRFKKYIWEGRSWEAVRAQNTNHVEASQLVIKQTSCVWLENKLEHYSRSPLGLPEP
jgi:hypothetical protein